MYKYVGYLQLNVGKTLRVLLLIFISIVERASIEKFKY